jgi:hypothetical protein
MLMLAVAARPAVSQTLPNAGLKPGSVLRVTEPDRTVIGRLSGQDSSGFTLLGPCRTLRADDCESRHLAFRFKDIHTIERRSDRVVEGTLIGAGTGILIGGLLGMLAPDHENREGFAIGAMVFIGVPLATFGAIKGSRSYRWVESPPPYW